MPQNSTKDHETAQKNRETVQTIVKIRKQHGTARNYKEQSETVKTTVKQHQNSEPERNNERQLKPAQKHQKPTTKSPQKHTESLEIQSKMD